nr:PREDICTED: uncharacterized protein LOC100877368 isoform X2 [Megachile rotundata]
MKTEVTGIDKALPVSDAKTSTETAEQTSPDAARERKFDFILENIENETNFEKIVRGARTNSAKDDSVTDSATSAPRNVVLVIAETGQDGDDFWKDFRYSHSFPVDGLLQNCNGGDLKTARFSLESALISGSKDKKCDCERFLGSNIAALLLWARDVKGMTIASLSNTNFTIPPLFEYEESVAIQRELDDPDKNNMKLEIRKIKPEIHGNWHTIDLGKPFHRASPLIPPFNNREDDAGETMWNVFDMFSKIRLALFRSLLDSLGGNTENVENSGPYSSYIRRSTLANIIAKLKAVENEKGFILTVTVPASELNSVVELLQKEVSQETLLVVTGVCSEGIKLVPFFAQGPAAKMIRETRIMWDLPMTIGHAIASGCQGSGCRSRRHDISSLPMTKLNNVPHNVAFFKRTLRDVEKKTNNDSKPDVSVSKEHEVKKVAALNSKMLLIQPTEEMSKQIRVELNENVATRDKDVEIIKEWLSKQPHLPPFDDDARIMTFLRGSKFSLEKCKKKLDMYFTMRAAIPEFFTNRDITRPELREITKIVQIPPLPGLTKNGRRVIVMRGIDKDLPTPNVAEVMKLVLMIGDVRLKEEQVGVAGDVYILDASVATPAHFAKFTPALVKKFLVCVQEAYPVKLKEVHVVNVSSVVDSIVNFVKPFLKEKIRNRIFMHSDMNTLYEYIPKEILPTEYGGDAGPIQAIQDTWIKKLEEYGPWFAQQESVKTNEMLRPGKPKTHDDLFGLDGSFRQLMID